MNILELKNHKVSPEIFRKTPFHFIVLMLLYCNHSICQMNLQITNWHDAGLRKVVPVMYDTINMVSFGADPSGIIACDSVFKLAISSNQNKALSIYFPPGIYLFLDKIIIDRNDLVLKGSGYQQTVLECNLSGTSKHCIQVLGTKKIAEHTFILNSVQRNDTTVMVENSTGFKIGDWVTLGMNDSSYFYSDWAYQKLIQTLQIRTIENNKIGFTSPIRFFYPESKNPFLTRIEPRTNIGIECMSIIRKDETEDQSSNIYFDKSVNCWVKGIESDSCNFAHITVTECSNIFISNSFFHNAFSYGSGGKAYGIVLQNGTGECKIEGNIFQRLRHSILLQSAANGNVVAYNYTRDPFWTGTSLPTNSAGDLVLHGNLPYFNLFEGNINQNTVIDDSHGKNGVFNTFFRNRSESYGIFMNTGIPTDSSQFLGNEVTNAFTGFYLLAGAGNLEFYNNVNGVITPNNSPNLTIRSLYLAEDEKPICPDLYTVFPPISYPNLFNSVSIPARDRFNIGMFALCECATLSNDNVPQARIDVSIYPNPTSDFINFTILNPPLMIHSFIIQDVLGRKMMEGLNNEMSNSLKLDIQKLASGLYIISIQDHQGIKWSVKFIKN